MNRSKKLAWNGPGQCGLPNLIHSTVVLELAIVPVGVSELSVKKARSCVLKNTIELVVWITEQMSELDEVSSLSVTFDADGNTVF